MGRRLITEKGARKFRDIVFPDEPARRGAPQPTRTRADRPRTPENDWRAQLAAIRDKLTRGPR